MSNEKAIVISQPWGGLGDNLQYSTLPELYAQLGFDVYISSSNAYRNPEIYDLVWKHNPYVKGVSDLPANAGACMFGGEAPTANYMTNIELGHGLTHGYRKYPVVYYKPRLVPELANVLLYDATSISSMPADAEVTTSFQSVIAKHPTLSVKRVQFAVIKNRAVPMFNHEAHIVHSIYELCDAMYSCKVFLTVFSGASVLASAIKQDAATPEIYCFHTPDRYPPDYMFKNIKYSPFLKKA